jgi:hypothetical protein
VGDLAWREASKPPRGPVVARATRLQGSTRTKRCRLHDSVAGTHQYPLDGRTSVPPNQPSHSVRCRIATKGVGSRRQAVPSFRPGEEARGVVLSDPPGPRRPRTRCLRARVRGGRTPLDLRPSDAIASGCAPGSRPRTPVSCWRLRAADREEADLAQSGHSVRFLVRRGLRFLPGRSSHFPKRSAN